MRLKHLLLGTVAALATVSTAQAEYTTPTGWYMSMAAGANWIDDGNIDEFSSGGSLSTTNAFDWESGWVVAGTIGYDFGKNWRVELEVAYRQNNTDHFCPSYTDTCFNDGDSDIWELSQMVNVMYDFPLGGNWEAAVGAGIGGNLVVFTPKHSEFESDNWGVQTDDYVLAGQLIAQIAYRLSERWQLFADYHYMFMDEPNVINPEDQERWVIEKTDHAVMLGIRFDLQRDGAAPPPRADTPRGSPKQFIVFFGFNKSNLTAEAAQVVAEAAAAAKEFGSASISVVGHTDTVGSNEYNIRLSMRRSDAVKSGLVSNGIADNAISTGGRGETELMVQTGDGDGVKEPQNRRATIDLN